MTFFAIFSISEGMAYPDKLYLRGTMEQGDAIILTHEESGIYKGEFEYSGFPVIAFGIYTELTGLLNAEAFWGTNSDMIRITDTSPVTMNMCQGENAHMFSIQCWGGGKGSVIVDWNKKTLTLQPHEQPYVIPTNLYLTGALNEWSTSDKDYELIRENDTWAYVGNFYIPEGKFEFRICIEEGNNRIFGLKSDLIIDNLNQWWEEDLLENEGSTISYPTWEGG